jgi:phosphoglycolate phosphatase-like HAD superfamily hydrolase
MLILFDIDGTMLSSEGVGVRSIVEATEKMFEKECSLDDILVGGRLDPLIWNDVCEKYGKENTEALHQEFRELYTELLYKNIATVNVRVLPGIEELLAACCEMDHVTMGLVTGNYKETGLMKICAAGLNPTMFVANAWGTDGAQRVDLPPIAIAAHKKDEPVVLIGDTIHDVTSGQATGCRVIAVCTGSHDRATLLESSPDLLVDDLSDTEAVLHWIFNTQTQSP